jgi:hypothetical protein
MLQPNQRHKEIPAYKPVLRLYKNTGLILLSHHTEVIHTSGVDGAWDKLRNVQLHNLSAGWWSLHGPVSNGLIMLINFVNYHKFRQAWQDYRMDPKTFSIRAAAAEEKRLSRTPLQRIARYAAWLVAAAIGMFLIGALLYFLD